MISGRVLVTGATGFVGSHLTRRLVEGGADVHIVTRHDASPARLGDVLPHLTRHLADLRDGPSVRQAIAQARPEYVFHLAGAASVPGVPDPVDDLVGTNVIGTVNLVDACEAVPYRGAVMTGDAFEYSPCPQPLAESAECRPGSLHGITKLAGTLYAQAMAAARGRPIVSLRLFSIYGPGDRPRRLIPRAIAAALAGRPLGVSRPEITRDWVYVDDVVDLYLEAALAAGRVSGQVFNAGSGVPASIREVIGHIGRLTERPVEAHWGTFTAGPLDDVPWVADPGRTIAQFDWRPRVSLAEGLARTIQAARETAPA